MLLDVFVTNLDLETATIGAQNALGFPMQLSGDQHGIIGKYLSRLRKLNHVIAPKEGFETQLRASRLPLPFGMRALGMTREIRHSRLQRGREPCHVPGLQGLDNPA